MVHCIVSAPQCGQINVFPADLSIVVNPVPLHVEQIVSFNFESAPLHRNHKAALAIPQTAIMLR